MHKTDDRSGRSVRGRFGMQIHIDLDGCKQVTGLPWLVALGALHHHVLCFNNLEAHLHEL